MESIGVHYKINVGDRLPKFSGRDYNGYEYASRDLVGISLCFIFILQTMIPTV